MYFAYMATAWLYLQMQSSDADDNISIRESFYPAVSAFNPDTEFCCNGVSGPYDSTPSARCCGQALYDYSRQMCCINELFPLEAGKVCCGNGTIDTASQLCCSGLTHPRSSNSVRCCRDATYDSTTQVCCPHYPPFIFNQDGDSSRSECCGDKKAYNPNTETCCLISVVNSEGYFQAQYRVMKKTNPTDLNCCGNVTFNPKTNICCGDKVYNNSYSCCADKELYLSSTQYCCMDYLSKEYEIMNHAVNCCGSKSHDPTKQACCKGKVKEITNSRTQQCCGDVIFDSDTEICCQYDIFNAVNAKREEHHSVIKKLSKGDNACCVNVSYNDQDQICCMDNTGKQYLARKLSQLVYKCCGNVAIGVLDGICCGGDDDNWETQPQFHKFQPSNLFGLQCCGNQAFNISTSICCGGLVLDISHGNAACCAVSVYNPNTEFCCMDYNDFPYYKIHNKIDSNPERNQCCGLEVYDTNTEMCCSNNVIKLQDGVTCCGDKTYDETKELCCSERVVTKQNENQNSCCYNSNSPEG